MADEILDTETQGNTESGSSNENANTEQTVLGGAQEQGEPSGQAAEGNQDGDNQNGSESQESDKSKEGEETDVPEKYEVTPPEGTTIDDDALEHWTPVFKEMGLNNEQVQKLLDATPEYIGKQVDQSFEKMVSYFKAEQDKQLTELKSDKEFGGQHWQETAQLAKSAFNKFVTSPEERAYFDESGQGNNPVLIKMFARIGKEMADTNLANGQEHASISATDFYSNTKMNP